VSMDKVFSQAVSDVNSLTSQAARRENVTAITTPNIKIAAGEIFFTTTLAVAIIRSLSVISKNFRLIFRRLVSS